MDKEVLVSIQAQFWTVNLLLKVHRVHIRAGRQARVPLMIGNNSAEIGGPFVNSSTSKEELFSMFGELKEEAKAAYDPDGTKGFSQRFKQDLTLTRYGLSLPALQQDL